MLEQPIDLWEDHHHHERGARPVRGMITGVIYVLNSEIVMGAGSLLQECGCVYGDLW